MIYIPKWLLRFLDVLTQLALVAAAAACALATVAPWGIARLFFNLQVHIPGAIYPDGMYVAAAASAAALIRRSRIAGIAAALVCFWAADQAMVEVPRQIIKAIAGAQMTLFPINSILDQAHLRELSVGAYNLPPQNYLDYGLGWTILAAKWLLGVSIAGLFFDPVIVWCWRRFGASRCRSCRLWIKVRRDADYCPRCGIWLKASPEPLRCRACRAPLNPRDNFCSVCGLAVAASPAEAVSL